jgi:hypothetical protein
MRASPTERNGKIGGHNTPPAHRPFTIHASALLPDPPLKAKPVASKRIGTAVHVQGIFRALAEAPMCTNSSWRAEVPAAVVTGYCRSTILARPSEP